MHGAEPRRLNHFCRGERWMLAAGCKAGHISSLAVPFSYVDTCLYAGKRCFVTAITATNLTPAGYRCHKKASRAAPARPCASRWTRSGRGVLRSRPQEGVAHMDHALALTV